MSDTRTGGVLVHRNDAITTITLDRPGTLNAFDASMAGRVADAIGEAAGDGSCRVIVLTGAGRSFCAGADLTQLRDIMATRDRERARAFVNSGTRIVQAIASAPKPVIAAVNGPAVGGGASLAMACDVRIASTEASIGMVFNRIGLHPDLGATYLLPALVGFGRGMELMLSGDVIGAADAHRIGLFNRVVPGDALVDETRALASKLAAKSPLALSRTKRSMQAAVHLTFEEAMATELEQQLALLETDEAQQALRAFMDKR